VRPPRHSSRDCVRSRACCRQHYLNWSPGVMDAFSDARRNRDYVQALESLAIVYSLP
jgi:hypothetical protein